MKKTTDLLCHMQFHVFKQQLLEPIKDKVRNIFWNKFVFIYLNDMCCYFHFILLHNFHIVNIQI